MDLKVIFFVIYLFHNWYADVKADNTSCPPRKNVICYWASWAVYRPGLGSHQIDKINPHLCTHLIYTFAGIDLEGKLQSLDNHNDIVNGGYKKIIGLKKINPCLKIMLAVGGWNEGSEKYSLMAETEESRQKFALDVIRFLIKYGFDGFDVDWEYPTERGGIPADKQNFVALLAALKDRLRHRNKILSVAVTASVSVSAQAYDIKNICQEIDFVSLMGYDMQQSNQTSIHSPLRLAPSDDQDRETLDKIVRYYKSQGCPSEKIILGIPAYGRSFTLENTLNTQIGAPVTGVGREGVFTREAGFLGYNEICELQKSRTAWQSVYVKSNAAVYGWTNKLWVSYDDPETIMMKAKYVLDENIGGMMMWSIDTDDFNGRCGIGPYPLLKAINSGLGNNISGSVGHIDF